ncbi:MAG: DUF3822 family protein [Aestuariibaculum sp.]
MATTNNTTNKLTILDLSIQLSLSGLSFCVLQRDTNTVIALKQIGFNKKCNPHEALTQLEQVFKTYNILNSRFNTITLIHDNELSAIVPSPLFNEDSIADYLKFNNKILKSDFLSYDQIQLNDTVNVYVPYVNINNFIYDKFGNFTYKHASTIFVEEILQAEKNSKNKKVFIDVSEDHFKMAVTNKGNLLLYNIFEYATKEDFIYYTLFTTEQLGLNPELFQLILLGNIDQYSELYTIAHKYIRFVFFGKRNDLYKYKLEAQPSSDHSNFILLNGF